MTNAQIAAEFEVVWNGAHTGGNEDLFRKPTVEEQKQPAGYDPDHKPWGFGIPRPRKKKFVMNMQQLPFDLPQVAKEPRKNGRFSREFREALRRAS